MFHGVYNNQDLFRNKILFSSALLNNNTLYGAQMCSNIIIIICLRNKLGISEFHTMHYYNNNAHFSFQNKKSAGNQG